MHWGAASGVCIVEEQAMTKSKTFEEIAHCAAFRALSDARKESFDLRVRHRWRRSATAATGTTAGFPGEVMITKMHILVCAQLRNEASEPIVCLASRVAKLSSASAFRLTVFFALAF